MKIVVVGAGIGGLSVYSFLKKLLPERPAPYSPHEIVIYESHDASQKKSSRHNPSSLPSVGAALGIAPNGMKVLRDLDPQIAAAITAAGYPYSFYRLQNAYGWTLVRFGASHPDAEFRRSVMCSRQAIWDALRDRIPDDAIKQKTIKEISSGEDGRPCIHLQDGSITDADIVIGADGVKSVVKRAVTGDGKSDDHPPVYDGLVGIGGFAPSSYLDPKKDRDSVTMTFGPRGFFGYGSVTSPRTLSPSNDDKNATGSTPTATSPFGPMAVWWSTYSLATPPESKSSIDESSIRADLSRRHAKYTDPVIQRIISPPPPSHEKPTTTTTTTTTSNDDDADIHLLGNIYPIYTTPPLPQWSKNNIILLGDAAHALSPTSGQGVSQALEDAETLALLLAHHLSVDEPDGSVGQEAVARAARVYERLRKPRVEKIGRYAARMADKKRDMSVWQEWAMYLAVWLMGLMGRISGNNEYARWLYAYDVEYEVRTAIQEEKEEGVSDAGSEE